MQIPKIPQFLKNTCAMYFVLLKAMVPTMILVKLAIVFGLLDSLAFVLTPIMAVVGLPAATALVFASGLLVNTYAACAALLTILPFTPLSIAEVTVLLSMVMIAHALPLEQGISRKAGLSFVFSSGLRFVTGITYGLILYYVYSGFDVLSTPVDLSWMTPLQTTSEQTWFDWAVSSVSMLFSLFWVILALVVLLRMLEYLKITDFLARLFSPILSVMGISPQATSITMVGVLLGLSYGGGLIIKEAREGRIAPKDVVLSLSFMGICHGLIEDPLFMMAFGGHWSGVLVGRFVFCVLVIALLSRALNLISEKTFFRLFYRPQKQQAKA